VDNGFLTPTLKLKRSVIEARYGGKMEDWYKKGQKVLWL
jgi:long-subunit acyl-CoA synthetase (AMP-forming)